MNKKYKGIFNIVDYVWGWLKQPFIGAIGLFINVIFRTLIVFWLGFEFSENIGYIEKNMNIYYFIIGFIWIFQPLIYSINEKFFHFKWKFREVENE